jgi:hypothetical protein
VHLIAGDDEVLAQHRHLDRRAHRREILERAAEPPALGEHADAPRAPARVLAREVGGVGDLGELTLRRRRALDLGDHGDAGATQRRVGVQRGWGRGGQPLQLVERHLLLPRLDVFADAGEDLVEDVSGRRRLALRIFSGHQRTPLSGCHAPDARRRQPAVDVRGMGCLTRCGVA